MPAKRSGAEDIVELRLRSRQDYLAKREDLQLALLRRQVAEEAEEERTNPRLSKREKQEFARNRETLRLATERLNIDEGLDGFHIPDADLDKIEALNSKRRQKDASIYKSEVQLWEDEVTARANAAQVNRHERETQEDYEFVFDPQQAVQWVTDGQWVDPEKQLLKAQLDAIEKKAKSIEEARKNLPIYHYKDQFIAAVADHQVLLVSADTGSGKTTQLTQYLLEHFKKQGGEVPKIACTQPRRVAAMSVAQRVSEERGCRLGQEVGYTIRFEDKTSPATKIQYMTDGVLLRQFLSDPSLASYGAIIIDEAHERTLATDILLGMIKDVGKYRPDLRIVIASATLNAQQFSRFFDDAPILFIPGRTHPIEIMYSSQPESNYLSAAVTTIFQIHVSQPPGDILVFLTGQDEIDAAQQNIEETSRKLGSRVPELVVCPIYSALPSDEQGKIFLPAPPKGRKVVLATNIAETSLTIDGIVYVIDSGYSKENMFNPTTGLEQLVVTPCSRASANQRAGRAGRTGPGKAFRLWTRWSHNNELEESATPEIKRVNLTSTLLLLKSIGINDLLNFDFMDPPSAEAIAKALEELYCLGALDSQGVLTRVGRSMSELPIDPKLSKTILAADKHSCLDEILTIVSMLGESAALFFAPKDRKIHADAAKKRFHSKEGGDHIAYLKIFNAWAEAEYDPLWAKENYLQQRTLTRARDVRDQLVKLCERIGVTPSSCGDSDTIPIRKALTAGYFSHAARMNKDGQSYRTVKTGMNVHIHPSSMCHEPTERPKWCLYAELVLTSKEFMRSIMPLEPQWLIDEAPHYIKQSELDQLGMDRKMGKEKAKMGAGHGVAASNSVKVH